MDLKVKLIAHLKDEKYGFSDLLEAYDGEISDEAKEEIKDMIMEDVGDFLESCSWEITRDTILTFEQCLLEEFLLNTQNYPKQYHELFHKKFNRAKKMFEEQ